jgi:hypothetical protein
MPLHSRRADEIIAKGLHEALRARYFSEFVVPSWAEEEDPFSQ